MRAVRVSIEREDPRLDFITINSNALHLAAHNGHVDVVKELLKAGANPNITNWIGEDPKHGASNGNRIEIVKELLKAGANPNTVKPNGTTVLFQSSYNGYLGIVQELLQAGPIQIHQTGEGRRQLQMLHIKVISK